MRRKLEVAVALAALVMASVAQAGSLESMGASSRGTAMGGAMISIADGSEAVFYNPSALALSRDSSSVSVQMVSGGLWLNDEINYGGGTGVRYGMSRRFLRDRLGVGLLVGLSPGSAGLSLDVGSLLGGGGTPNWNWAIYKDSSPLILQVGFGIRITDWLSVGVSGGQKDSLVTTSYYQVVVDPILEQLIGISTGVTPVNMRTLAFGAGADPASDLNWGYNVTLRPIKYLSLGYMYKPESWSRYKIRVELVGGGGSILPQSQYIIIDMQVPGQLETTIYGAAGHIPIPANDGTLTLAYAHEEQNWDGFYGRTVQYQWDADSQFGNEFFDLAEGRDPGLNNVAFDRFGFEYEGDGSVLVFHRMDNARFYVRGGYYHWNSPQDPANRSWRIAMIDSDADVYSFGVGLGFDRRGKRMADDPLTAPRMQIDLHFQTITVEDRDYEIKPDAFGNVPFDNYSVETSGNLTNMGVQITWWQ